MTSGRSIGGGVTSGRLFGEGVTSGRSIGEGVTSGRSIGEGVTSSTVSCSMKSFDRIVTSHSLSDRRDRSSGGRKGT